MTFGPFSKSATNAPNITTKIRIAPRIGASGIAIVIFGALTLKMVQMSLVLFYTF